MTAENNKSADRASLIKAAQSIEVSAYLDMFRAAPAVFADEQQLRTEVVSGVTCFALKNVPVSLFNRTLEMGVKQPATEQSLREIIGWMRDHANQTFNIGLDINAQPLRLSDWLKSSDLKRSGGGIARFWRPTEKPLVHVETDLVVRKANITERDLGGRLITEAFGFQSSFSAWFSQLICREDWHFYFACDGEKPIATGAIYFKNGLAWLGVGATLKEYRGRGAQSLLLNHRIRDALSAGATSIHVETGQPADGEPIGASYRNILRSGFEVLFIREQYMPISS